MICCFSFGDKKKKQLIIALVVLAIFLACPVYAKGKESISFETTISRLSPAKTTTLKRKNYWQGIRNKKIKWSGKVVDVTGGRASARIYLVNNKGENSRGYNIILDTYQLKKASDLDVGQKISFSGIVHKYKAKRGQAVLLYLRAGDIL